MPQMQDSQEHSGVTDSTFFEAEHIPVKVYMKPHHCASDPRLKLDLKQVCLSAKAPLPHTRLDAPKKKDEESGTRKVFDREKLIKIHARAASDIISALKTEAKSPESHLNRKQVASRHAKKGSLTFLPSVAHPIGTQSVKHLLLTKGRTVGNLSPVLSKGLLSTKSAVTFPLHSKLISPLKFR